MAEEIHSSDAPLHVREGVGEQARAQGTFAHSPVLGGRAVQLEAVLAPWVKDPDLLPRPGPRHLDGTHGFCQNSGLSRHGGKLTQKLGPG